MPTVKKVVLPQPGPNDYGSPLPVPWEQEEIKKEEYSGLIGNSDPRDMSAVPSVPQKEEYPGSGVPGEPWQSAPTPALRRLRRDK